jgi:hypothetical protein
MDAQVLAPTVTNQQKAAAIAKVHTATTSAPEPHSSKADTRNPPKVDAAPWGAYGDWKTHLHDHRSREPDSLVPAFNKPIETSSLTNIVEPLETLTSLAALTNDQCVATLQKAFDDHQKLVARLESLASEEEETRKAYMEAVRKREEAERALMENKTVMGCIAGRLADARGVNLD